MKYIEYNENKRHGTDEFPIEYYLVDEDHHQYVMPLHWHLEFEILLVTSGELELYLDNKQRVLSAGDIAFIECGTLHRATPTNAVYECLVFNPNMLKGKNGNTNDRYLAPIINRTITIDRTFHLCGDDLSLNIISLFKAMREREPYYELEVYGLLCRFFAILYRIGAFSKKATDSRNVHRNKIMSDLLEWIDIHYSEPITLKDLSISSGLSEKYLCRVFKSYTSRSPIEYINYLRISKVCHDLDFSDCSITEAAFNNGFNNLSYFSKMFRKYKSESPRQYSKKRSGHRTL